MPNNVINRVNVKEVIIIELMEKQKIYLEDIDVKQLRAVLRDLAHDRD